MAFWCIDPTNGSDSTGASNAVQATAETTPYKTTAEVVTAAPAAGDSVLYKGGDLEVGTQTLGTGFDGSIGTPIIIGSYGTGKGGVDADSGLTAIATNSNVYLTFDGIELKGSNAAGTGNECLLITAATVPTEVNIIVKNSLIHEALTGDGADGQGMDIRASKVEVLDTNIEDVYDDGLYIEGNDVEIHHNTIQRVDLTPDVKGGDCCKFSSTGACTNNHAHHNILDHSNNGRKQALIMAGSGTGAIGEHNLCKGGEATISCKSPAATVRRNLVYPTIPNHPSNGNIVPPITVTKGINLETYDSITVESNVIDTALLGSPTHVIHSVTGNSHIFQGNVVHGATQSDAGNNASLRFNAGTNHIIRNNIIGRGDGVTSLYHISAGAAVTFAYCDYNIYLEDRAFLYNSTPYANLAAWKAGTGFDEHSVIVDADTLFKDAANGDFRLNEGQERLGAQIGYGDFLGRRNFPTIIGAYIQDTSSSRSQDITRSQDSTRSQDTTRAQRDVLYPDWGVRA